MHRCFIAFSFLLLPFVTAAWGQDQRQQVGQANQVVETKFEAASPHTDPFNDVTLDAVFTDPHGVKLRVPCFWDGGNVWKARYASSIVGTHHFRTECSDLNDAGLNGVEGSIEIQPYKGDNPLFVHGPIQVAPDHRHLQHADGTPFLWLADTWWMGLSKRLHWPDEFHELTADRKAKGFNVIQIVAGLYPDQGAFDERSANESGFAWEKDYSHIRPEYFDLADQRIEYLVDQGFVPCIVGAWGYHLPWLGIDKMKKHMRYISARWGAMPVTWCVAGEFNLPFYLTPGFPGGGEKQAKDWAEVIAYFRTVDPFGRLITAHPTGIGPLSARLVLKDDKLLDFDMLQTGHGLKEVLGPTIGTLRNSYNAQPPMPVIDAEVAYEALSGRIPADIPREMCWVCLLSGAAGHTYGANGIWQLNRKDAPYGNSPFGGNYGPIPWDEAMRLPGSKQVGLAKKLIEKFDWPHFQLHPEWNRSGGASPMARSQWIWFPEGDPAVDAPIAARFFRRSFELPANAQVKSAMLQMTADDRFTVWVNDQQVGAGDDWRNAQQFGHIERLLRAGKNVIAARAENMKSDVVHNPAGLIGSLVIQAADGSTVAIESDGAWRAAQAEAEGWRAVAFDDASWPTAKVLAPLGGGPWGGASPGGDSADTCYAAGISGKVRIIYFPDTASLTVYSIEPGAHYTASSFDPVTGETHAIGPVAPDASGNWQAPDPKVDHDWVVVLEGDGAQPTTTP